MPGGNIFKLDGGADFDLQPDGMPLSLLKGSAYADLLLNAEADFTVDNGNLNIALGHEFRQNTTLGLDTLIGGGQAHGAALASLNVAARSGFPINVFKAAGFVAEVKAAAEVSVAGRLACSLSQDSLVGLAVNQFKLKGLEVDIFREFVKMVEVEAGVWGRVNAGIAAQAFLKLYGTLESERNAGFYFEAGAQAAYAYGAGYQVGGGIAFENPRNFYTQAIRLIMDEITAVAQQGQLSKDLIAIDFLASVGLKGAYDLGQLSETSVSSDENIRRVINSICCEEIRRLVLQTSFEAATVELLQLAQYCPKEAEMAAVSFAKALAEAPIDSVDDKMLESAHNLLDSLDGIDDIQKKWDAVLVLIWCVKTLFHFGREASANIRMSVNIGSLVNESGAHDAGHLEPAPIFVKEILEQNHISLSGDEVAVVLGCVKFLCTTFRAANPPQNYADLLSFLDRLTSADGKPKDISLLLTDWVFNPDQELDSDEIYRVFSGFCKEISNDLFCENVPNILAKSLDSNGEVKQIYERIVYPSLAAAVNFVFRHADLALNNPWKLNLGVLNELQSGFSLLVMRIFGRNVSMLASIVVLTAIDNISTGFDEVAGRLKSDPRSKNELAKKYGLSPRASVAVVALLDSISELGSELFGPTVWTVERRRKLAQLFQRLVCVEVGKPDNELLRNREWWQKGVTGFINSPNLLNDNAPKELGRLFAEILAADLRVLRSQSLDITEAVAYELWVDVVEEMTEVLDERINELATDIRRLREEIADINGKITREIDEKRELIRNIAGALSSDNLRSEILDRIEREGKKTAADAAAEAVKSAYEQLPRDKYKDRAVRTARQLAEDTFLLGFIPARQVLETLLITLGGFFEAVEKAVESGSDVDDVLGKIRGNLKAQISQRGLPGVSGMPPGKLLDLVTGKTVEMLVRQKRRELERAVALRKSIDETRANKKTYESDLGKKNREVAELRTSKPGSALSYRITLPHALDATGRPYLYAAKSPVCIQITGFDERDRSKCTQGVRVFLNGSEIPLDRMHTEYDEHDKHACILVCRVDTVEGLNRLTVVAASSQGGAAIQESVFLASDSVKPTLTLDRTYMSRSVNVVQPPPLLHRSDVLPQMSVIHSGQREEKIIVELTLRNPSRDAVDISDGLLFVNSEFENRISGKIEAGKPLTVRTVSGKSSRGAMSVTIFSCHGELLADGAVRPGQN